MKHVNVENAFMKISMNNDKNYIFTYEKINTRLFSNLCAVPMVYFP